MSDIGKRLVAERQRTHGPFGEVAALAAELKAVLVRHPKWRLLSVRRREILSMISLKEARILCGDPDHPDHWNDMAGYAVMGPDEDAGG